MDWREVQQRMKRRFGSVFPKSYDIEKHIAILYEAVRATVHIKELKKHPGWLGVEKALTRLVAELDELIVAHAGDPAGNVQYLIALKASRDAYLGLIGLVDDNIEVYDTVKPQLEERLKLFKETTGFGRTVPVDDNPDPAPASAKEYS